MNKLTLQMPHQLFIGGTFVDAEGTKTYETINPTDGSVSAGPAPASLLPPTVTPPMTYSPPSPHLASGGPSPGGLCLDTKVLQSVSSLPYRNSIEEDMVGRGWWGSRRTLNVFSLLQRLGVEFKIPPRKKGKPFPLPPHFNSNPSVSPTFSNIFQYWEILP